MERKTTTTNTTSVLCRLCGCHSEEHRMLLDQNGNKLCPVCYRSMYGNRVNINPGVYPPRQDVPPGFPGQTWCG